MAHALFLIYTPTVKHLFADLSLEQKLCETRMNINDMNILVGAEPQEEMTVDLSLSNLNTRERMREKRTSSVLRRFGLSRMSIRIAGLVVVLILF